MESVNLQEKAADWLIELKTAEDQLALLPKFHAWLYEAPENRSAYLEVEQAWKLSAQAIESAIPHGCRACSEFIQNARSAAGKRVTRRSVRVRAAVTSAVMVILMGVVSVFVSHLVTSRTWNRYETAYGVTLPVTLSDGSQIQLNTNSRLWVRMTPQNREVALEQGEALFTVEPDQSRPFTVSVDHDEIRATGTRFSVRREQGGEVDACVQEGSIKVPDRRPYMPGGTAKYSTVVVKAGDSVTITPERTVVETLGTATVGQRLAWITGKIDFDGTLGAAVREFNRYNRRKLEIADPSLSERHIQGLFRATDPDEFAAEVQRKLGIPTSSTGSALAKDGVIKLGG